LWAAAVRVSGGAHREADGSFSSLFLPGRMNMALAIFKYSRGRRRSRERRARPVRSGRVSIRLRKMKIFPPEPGQGRDAGLARA